MSIYNERCEKYVVKFFCNLIMWKNQTENIKTKKDKMQIKYYLKCLQCM